ncbi:hypothetical protein [Streptomyces albiflavescens]|uniref:hypothetical protein n=1 Tax=Streptomyces albiflavescens TaxID=1623582 RepID=UPI0016637F54|nr:hypothetical protein [Streptomyces albiflavescens]
MTITDPRNSGRTPGADESLDIPLDRVHAQLDDVLIPVGIFDDERVFRAEMEVCSGSAFARRGRAVETGRAAHRVMRAARQKMPC